MYFVQDLCDTMVYEVYSILYNILEITSNEFCMDETEPVDFRIVINLFFAIK